MTRARGSLDAFACVFVLANGLVVACGAPERDVVPSPVTPAEEPVRTAPPPVMSAASAENAPDAAAPAPSAPPALPPRRREEKHEARTTSFGPGPVEPSAPHAFKLAANLKAARASPSGKKTLEIFSLLPETILTKQRTAVDPFADGEWLLVYGEDVDVPGNNVNAVRHGRPAVEVSGAIAKAGFLPLEEGPKGAVRTELFDVRDALFSPTPSLLVMAPRDRAKEISVALVRPVDPGFKSGELARVFFKEPWRATSILPKSLSDALVVVRPASDDGLDVSAEATCPDEAACKEIAEGLRQRAARMNSLMVRVATRGLLIPLTVEGKPGGEGIRAEGTKLRASVHAAPDQVQSILNFVRAALGLPAADPGSP
ncbi:hypothetical protein AKJ09_11496 [Labilithrix luteola]|uniref:Uncharacterized protein n=1 Tax=Labilithrix luteola TaxID=1391654 RepID=A0A0K1QGI6_9BACT|nr:hypothetical protein [Labilithrix luteola]AKV04833.1 hypothetical protein AKJ09_11496 [Labilithrix luteola]